MAHDDGVMPMRVACVLDPALDWERSTGDVYTRYIETRDPGLIQAKPGEHLLWFVVRPLTVELAIAVDSQPTGPAKLKEAFRVGVIAIENWHAPGHALSPSGTLTVDGSELPVWSREEMNAIHRRLKLRWIYEIGNVIFERELGNGGSGGVPFTLPHSSIVALGQIGSPHAAPRTPSDGTGSSETPPSSSTPRAAKNSGKAGAARAGAKTGGRGGSAASNTASKRTSRKASSKRKTSATRQSA